MGWYLGHKGLLAPPPPSQCAHVACFCKFFKIFHVRLGKKTKTVSFYSGVPGPRIRRGAWRQEIYAARSLGKRVFRDKIKIATKARKLHYFGKFM